MFSVSPSPVNSSFRLGVDPLRCQYPNAAFRSKRFLANEANCLKLTDRVSGKSYPVSRRNVCTNCSSGDDLGERIIVGDSDNPEESVKLVCDESGCAVVIGKKVKVEDSDIESDYESGIESDDEIEGDTNRPYYLSCNLRGCSFSPVAPAGGIMELKGESWSLKYDSAPNSEKSICAQISSNGWSIALSASEFDNFCKLIQDIRNRIVEVDDESVEGTEIVNIELSKDSIQMNASFPVHQLSQLKNVFRGEEKFKELSLTTQFVLSGQYSAQVQGNWPFDAFYSMSLQSSDSIPNSAQESHLQAEIV